MTIILALLNIVSIGAALRSNENQHKDLDRIKQYEIIKVDTSSFLSDGIIEFDAYDQHYTVQLYPNEHLHPGKVRYTNGDYANKQGDQQLFTQLNQPCHYHGKVSNDLESNKNFAALSLCNGRGIRGMIVAFDDTLYIKPAKVYLDVNYDKSGYQHQLNDDHLVYLSSDTDNTDYHQMVLIYTAPDFASNKDQQHRQRRRMQNHEGNLVETYIISDPAYTQTFRDQYNESVWYKNLVLTLFDMINSVSIIYNNQV